MNLSFQRKSEHLANIPDARLHMVRQYTQCTGTVRTIAPSPNKEKWALGLLDKLEFDYICVIFFISSTISLITPDIFFLNIPSNNL